MSRASIILVCLLTFMTGDVFCSTITEEFLETKNTKKKTTKKRPRSDFSVDDPLLTGKTSGKTTEELTPDSVPLEVPEQGWVLHVNTNTKGYKDAAYILKEEFTKKGFLFEAPPPHHLTITPRSDDEAVKIVKDFERVVRTKHLRSTHFSPNPYEVKLGDYGFITTRYQRLKPASVLECLSPMYIMRPSGEIVSPLSSDYTSIDRRADPNRHLKIFPEENRETAVWIKGNPEFAFPRFIHSEPFTRAGIRFEIPDTSLKGIPPPLLSSDEINKIYASDDKVFIDPLRQRVWHFERLSRFFTGDPLIAEVTDIELGRNTVTYTYRMRDPKAYFLDCGGFSLTTHIK